MSWRAMMSGAIGGVPRVLRANTTAVVGSVAVLGVGIWLAARNGDPTIIQRAGAAVIIGGVWLAALPYVREGHAAAVEKTLPSPGSFLVPTGTRGRVRAEARAKASRDVWAERSGSVALILIGTAINGFGDLLIGWAIR